MGFRTGEGSEQDETQKLKAGATEGSGVESRASLSCLSLS